MIKLTAPKKKNLEVLPEDLKVGKIYKFAYNDGTTTVHGLMVNNERGEKKFLELVNNAFNAEIGHVWSTKLVNGNLAGKFYLSDRGISIEN